MSSVPPQSGVWLDLTLDVGCQRFFRINFLSKADTMVACRMVCVSDDRKESKQEPPSTPFSTEVGDVAVRDINKVKRSSCPVPTHASVADWDVRVSRPLGHTEIKLNDETPDFDKNVTCRVFVPWTYVQSNETLKYVAETLKWVPVRAKDVEQWVKVDAQLNGLPDVSADMPDDFAPDSPSMSRMRSPSLVSRRVGFYESLKDKGTPSQRKEGARKHSPLLREFSWLVSEQCAFDNMHVQMWGFDLNVTGRNPGVAKVGSPVTAKKYPTCDQRRPPAPSSPDALSSPSDSPTENKVSVVPDERDESIPLDTPRTREGFDGSPSRPDSVVHSPLRDLGVEDWDFVNYEYVKRRQLRLPEDCAGMVEVSLTQVIEQWALCMQSYLSETDYVSSKEYETKLRELQKPEGGLVSKLANVFGMSPSKSPNGKPKEAKTPDVGPEPDFRLFSSKRFFAMHHPSNQTRQRKLRAKHSQLWMRVSVGTCVPEGFEMEVDGGDVGPWVQGIVPSFQELRTFTPVPSPQAQVCPKCAELQQIVDGLQEDAEQRTASMTQLRDQLKAVNQDRGLLQQHLSELQSTHGALAEKQRTTADELSQALDDHSDKVSALESQYSELNAQYGRCSARVLELEAALTEAQGDAQIADEQRAREQKELADAQAALAAELSQRSELESALEAARREQQQLSTQLRALTQSLAEQSALLSELQASGQSASTDLEASKDKIGQLQAELQEERSKAEKMAGQLQDGESSLSEQTQALRDAKEKVSQLEAELQKQTLKAEGLAAQLEEMENAQTSSSKQVEDAKKELQAEKDALEAEAKEVKKLLAESQAACGVHETAVREASRKVENLEAQLREAEEKAKSTGQKGDVALKKVREEADRRVKHATELAEKERTTADSERARADECATECAQLKQQLAEAKRVHVQLTAERDRLTGQIRDLDAALSVAEGAVSALENGRGQHGELSGEVQRLKDELKSAKNRAAAAQRAHASANQEAARSRRVLWALLTMVAIAALWAAVAAWLRQGRIYYLGEV